MLIDWFSFTLNAQIVDKDYAIKLIGLDEWESRFEDIGARQRYEHCWKFGNISILTPYPDKPDMGVQVNMTGQGCRELEKLLTDRLHTFTWRGFLKKLVAEVNKGYRLNITRIDLAFDDFEGLLNMSEIERKLREGEFSSRLRQVSKKESTQLLDSEDTWSKRESLGKTFYVGNKSSSAYCKFYDKLQEQKRSKKDDDIVMKKLEKVNHWVRFEATFKDAPAMNVCNTICFAKEDSDDLQQFINRYFRFIEKDDSNITRCTISKFWADFIGSKEAGSAAVQGDKWFGYEKTYRWFKKSLVASVYALMVSFDTVDDFIKETVRLGEPKVREKHQKIMDGLTQGRALSTQELWTLNNNYTEIIRQEQDAIKQRRQWRHDWANTQAKRTGQKYVTCSYLLQPKPAMEPSLDEYKPYHYN